MTLNDTGVFSWTNTGIPASYLAPSRSTEVRRPAVALKRALDVVLAACLLIASAPILLFAVLAIRLTSRGPALFVQERFGYGGCRFSMYKLRTMVHGAERHEARLAAEAGSRIFFKLEDDPRITPVGRWLRRYSLDELPQLWNVLRGDMSLIGPRPPLISDLGRFPRYPRRCFSVRPGLTGLWQVSGRSLLSDADRIRLDTEYVDRWTFRRDLMILARTLPAVLSGRGAG